MAAGDKVATIRDIKSFDPKTNKIRADAIPSGSVGTVIIQDDNQQFVTVRFAFSRQGIKTVETIIGQFGVGLVDTIENSLVVVVDPVPVDVLRAVPSGLQATASLKSQQLSSN